MFYAYKFERTIVNNSEMISTTVCFAKLFSGFIYRPKYKI